MESVHSLSPGYVTGTSVVHPGIGPHTNEDDKVYHAYYQWVPFVLFLQVSVGRCDRAGKGRRRLGEEERK